MLAWTTLGGAAPAGRIPNIAQAAKTVVATNREDSFG
jgi:hypothetical protein